MKKNDVKHTKGLGALPYFILALVLAFIVTVFINI